MRSIATILTLAGLVAACHAAPTAQGGNPPPPPDTTVHDTTPKAPPGIARVVLVTDSGTLFTGTALPGQRFIAAVLDSAGDTVRDAAIALATASPGWTVTGDTVIAPAREGVGAVTVTASRTDPSSASATIALTDVLDPTLYHWHLHVGCRVLAPQSVTSDSGIGIDSIIIDASVDSFTTLIPQADLAPGVGGIGDLWWSTGVTQYLVDGSVYQPTIAPQSRMVLVLPDTISFAVDLAAVKPDTGTAVRYAAPADGWCQPSYDFAPLDSLVVTGAP